MLQKAIMETNFKNRETQERNIKSQQRNKIYKKEAKEILNQKIE